MKPSLVIMAAGMGSRYGGLKQIDSVGPHGERIIDYSMFDAIRAGFGKIVFIIRRDIEQAFREAIEPVWSGRIPIEYVFQEIDSVPVGTIFPENRRKPWGTGHAILCCRDVVHESFGVINADDFYGRDAFEKLFHGLSGAANASTYMLVGYKLINTLSPHGSVSRGVCETGPDGFLNKIIEKSKLNMLGGELWSVESGGNVPIRPDTVVSMNMWGFTPEVFDALESAFSTFLSRCVDDVHAEFFIPSVIDAMINSHLAQVKVAMTDAGWMGLTYPDDRDAVRSGIEALIVAGDYPSPLWPVAEMEGGGIFDHDGKKENTRQIYRQSHQPRNAG